MFNLLFFINFHWIPIFLDFDDELIYKIKCSFWSAIKHWPQIKKIISLKLGVKIHENCCLYTNIDETTLIKILWVWNGWPKLCKNFIIKVIQYIHIQKDTLKLVSFSLEYSWLVAIVTISWRTQYDNWSKYCTCTMIEWIQIASLYSTLIRSWSH